MRCSVERLTKDLSVLRCNKRLAGEKLRSGLENYLGGPKLEVLAQHQRGCPMPDADFSLQHVHPNPGINHPRTVTTCHYCSLPSLIMLRRTACRDRRQHNYPPTNASDNNQLAR